MKFFIFFCLLYSVALFADQPKKMDKVKKAINETADQIDHGTRKVIKEAKKLVNKKR